MFAPAGRLPVDAANTRVPCLPGPAGHVAVVNSRAVEDAIKIGLALNCKVAATTKFDRKNYAYPDLMKGYQISQYDVPICYDGYMDLPVDPSSRIGSNGCTWKRTLPG